MIQKLFEFRVPSYTFYVRADSEEDAASKVEDQLNEISRASRFSGDCPEIIFALSQTEPKATGDQDEEEI